MKTDQIAGVDLATVFWFAGQGFSVIPCHLGSKIPKIKWGVYKDRLPSSEELIRWFRVPSNAAVVTGTNNLVVIDFDDIGEYIHWSQWVITEGSWAARMVLSDAYKVRTARGLHVYTRSTADVRNLHFGRIDVKGRGGLVTLPGSVHPSGAIYREYQSGGFPIWHDLTELFPRELLAEAVTPEISSDARRHSASEVGAELTSAEVLDAVVGVKLDEVKARHRIEQYLPEITFTGAHWGLTKCPFHEDNNPSFWVDTERQLCGCFSGCTSKPLDVIDLYARLHKISNREAIQELGSLGA